ncbi:hypothetical protein [Streptosporangium sp. NPDC048865]|uniref:hypothetical protein n=1 Tax=Streptosporangium sp. NPDC048865 TaxID=3155766 RepID=UPI003435B92F
MTDLPPVSDLYTEEERNLIASRLLPIAAHLVCAIRDEGPDATADIIRDLSPSDWVALTGLLAALVPTDKSLPELLAWTDDVWPLGAENLPAWLIPFAADREPHRNPCGTHAGFNRHKANDENICTRCAAAERVYQRAHKRHQTAQRHAANAHRLAVA